MGVNKVVFGAVAIMDISDSTVTAETLAEGETAYRADGEKITGTAKMGGIDTSDATATAGDILSGKTAYAKGNKVTGTIATKTSSNLTASGATVTVPAGYYASQATKSVATATQATPSVSIDSAGKITASATQSAGYVSAGTKTGTKQLTTKGATTYTPSTSNQTIASGTYLTGTQTIKGDSNLVAGNIKSGVSIFGVTGNYSGSGGSGGSGGDNIVEVTIRTFDFGFGGNCSYLSRNGSFVDVSYEYDGVTVEALNGIVFCKFEITDGNYTDLLEFDRNYIIYFANGTANAYLITGGDMQEGGIPGIPEI